MAFSHACFISYRHRPGSKDYKTVIDDLRDALQNEVLLWMNPAVYLDYDRLRGGNFFNQALSKAICESVCMVVFYIPPYFDPDYSYCAREFKAMEQLEAQRLKALGIAGGPNGLIIPVVCRGWDTFPAEIKGARQCYNFEPYYMEKRKISQHAKGRAEIKQIAKYIFDRYQEMKSADAALCSGCDTFSLPQEGDVLPWLRQLLASPGGQPSGSQFPRL
jgi:hypothetical protein